MTAIGSYEEKRKDLVVTLTTGEDEETGKLILKRHRINRVRSDMSHADMQRGAKAIYDLTEHPIRLIELIETGELKTE